MSIKPGTLFTVIGGPRLSSGHEDMSYQGVILRCISTSGNLVAGLREFPKSTCSPLLQLSALVFRFEEVAESHLQAIRDAEAAYVD